MEDRGGCESWTPGPLLKRGFSLIELLVVMTLLTVIVLGLMVVFGQTQRAFKVGLSQVDVLESGRAAMDLITGEVKEMAAMSGLGTNWVNCLVAIPSANRDLYQELPGSAVVRTNVLQNFFFVSQVNREWIGTGYTIIEGPAGIGTLYRYQTNLHERHLSRFTPPEGLLALFLNDVSTANASERLTRVVDGVIHFRIQAYGTNGILLDPFYDRGAFTDITVDYDPVSPSEFFYEFRRRTLPTAMEIELAVVEPDVVERVQALPAAGTVRRDYLAKEAGKVHIFRQRVPVWRSDSDTYK